MIVIEDLRKRGFEPFVRTRELRSAVGWLKWRKTVSSEIIELKRGHQSRQQWELARILAINCVGFI